MWTGSQPGRRGLCREPVAGHRRHDDVERVRRIAAVGGRVGERPDHVEHLDDRAGPAVRDDQRQRVLVRRAHVDEVDVEAVDLGDELRERVQPRLETSHVVLVGPVAHERLDRRELDALRGVRDGLILGEAGLAQAAAQVLQRAVGDVDAELADRGCFHRGCGHAVSSRRGRDESRRASTGSHPWDALVCARPGAPGVSDGQGSVKLPSISGAWLRLPPSRPHRVRRRDASPATLVPTRGAPFGGRRPSDERET